MTRNLTHSSSAYASCHLEWGPSRQLAWGLLSLGLLAVAALHASDLSGGWAWAGTPAILAYAAWLARRESRKPVRTLVVMSPRPDALGAAGGPEELPPILLDGVPMAALEVTWRGTAAFLHGRAQGGRRVRTVLWPDVTTGDGRRELRLALLDRATSPSRPSVAP